MRFARSLLVASRISERASKGKRAMGELSLAHLHGLGLGPAPQEVGAAPILLRRPHEAAGRAPRQATEAAASASASETGQPGPLPAATATSGERAARKKAARSAGKAAEEETAKKQPGSSAALLAAEARPAAKAVPLPAGEPLLREPRSGREFSLLSYNVLLPNSKDGWWIYKYYRDPGDGTIATWPHRQAILQQQLRTANADIVCVQEATELSFENDFAFMRDNGYEGVLHQKVGRMRPATFWSTARWKVASVHQKDRTLVTALTGVDAAWGARPPLFVVNAHLSAGPSADRRLRQTHEALDVVSKEAKKLNLDVASCPVVFCGDLNSQGSTGVRELLVAGEVGPDFRESGDPTEKGQEGKQITSKARRQGCGAFADVGEECFGVGRAPPTIICTNIDAKMLTSERTLTTAVASAIQAAFEFCCSPGKTVMEKQDIDRWLLLVNKELGRGSEYRAAEAAMESSGQPVLTKEDFQGIYKAELEEGKYWAVEHDLSLMGGQGLAVPSEGPCELCFDHIFYSTQSLCLLGVQEPLTEQQKKKVYSEPWDVLPNAWHPSDHLPVAATFALR